MTAITAVRRDDGLILMTDAAAYDATGMVRAIGPKVILFPHLPAVIAVRGSKDVQSNLLSLQVAHQLADFDDLLDYLPTGARVASDLAAPVAQFGINEGNAEIVLAGWSKARNKPEIWWMPTYATQYHDAAGQRVDAPAYQPVEWESPYLGQMPPDDVAAEFGFQLPVNPNEFAPMGHGLAWMQSLRRTTGALPFYSVGGYVQCTSIGPTGLDSAIIHRWPDQIGQTISPR